jgi:Predicted exporters of the RND superfamily
VNIAQIHISIKQWFVDQALQHSRRTITLSILATLFMGSGIRFLVMDDDMMKMLPKELESKVTWDAIQNEFGSTEIIFIAFGRQGESAYQEKTLADLWTLTEQLNILSTVDDISNISNATRIDQVDGFLEIDDLQIRKVLSSSEIDDIKVYLNKNQDLKKQLVSKGEEYLLTIIQPFDQVGLDQFRNDIVSVADSILSNYDVHYGGTAYVTGSVPTVNT